MPGQHSGLNPLESRKRLLLAESELNRAQLVGDVADMDAGLRQLGERAKSFETVASSAAVLVAAWAATRRGGAGDPGAKRSWLARLLKGAGFASTVWLAFRSPRREQPNR